MTATRTSPVLLLGGVVAGWVVLRTVWLYATQAALGIAPAVMASGTGEMAMPVAVSPAGAVAVPAAGPWPVPYEGDRPAAPIARRHPFVAGGPALGFDAVQGPLMMRLRARTGGRFSFAGGGPMLHPVRLGLFAAPLPTADRRWSVSAWGHYRSGDGIAALANPGQAGGAQLGGSQLGMALRYRLDRSGRIAAVARLSSTRGGAGATGAEGALGLAFRPVAALPVTLVAERRQALAGPGGRNATALYAVGGVSARPLAAGFALDAYGAAGVVGTRRRDVFAEGWAVASRPVVRAGPVRLSVGAGSWVAAQPGVSRVDVGPSVSARWSDAGGGGPNPRLSVDWRQRVAGDAAPGSGLAVTLGVDF